MAVKHAVLSASSSERWLNCPPSARLCEAYEDKGSNYAAEGTDAHALCEFRLKQALGIPADNPIESLSWYNEEMEDCAAGYAAYVSELLETAKQTCADPVILIEQRVDFSRWVRDGFGTADCIVIADGEMNIVDYKHGKGVEVSAVDNPQMMLYALGALEIFDGIYDIDSIRMTIYQPRKSNISVCVMEKDELLEWAQNDLTYRDGKRGYIDSEKKIQIVDDVYKVRTVTDTRDTDGSAVTEVYAEAEFYDLTFSVRKEERTFEAEYPETAMAYALEGTEWSVGTVTVRTQRTWTSTEKNALSILRNVANLHGGDLVFDCPNRLVHLLTVNGKDSGALFA